MNTIFLYEPPYEKRKFMTLAQSRVWRVEHPVGDPFGGPAYGEYLGCSDPWEWAKKEISNAASAVGDAFAKLDKEVFQPVGAALKPIGKMIEADPAAFIAQIAAVALAPVTAGQSLWAIPVIQGVAAKSHGADWENTLKVTAISAATVYAGQTFTPQLSSGLQAAGLPAQAATAVSAVVVAGSTSAAGAAVMGKNSDQILMAALTSGAAAAVPSMLGAIPGFDKLAQGKIEGLNATISKGIASAVQSVASGTIGAVINNKDPAQGAMMGIMSAGISTAINGMTKLTESAVDLFSDPKVADQLTKQPSGTQTLIANAVVQTLSAAATGGNISAAFNQAMLGAATSAIGQTLAQNGGAINFLTNAITGDWSKLDLTLKQYQNQIQEYEGIAEERNALADEAEGERIRQEAILAQREQYIDQYEGLHDGIEDYKTTVTQEYNDVKARGEALNAKAAAIKTASTNQQTYINKANAQYKTVQSYADAANTALKNAQGVVDHLNTDDHSRYTDGAAAVAYHKSVYDNYIASYNNYKSLYTSAQATYDSYVASANSYGNQAQTLLNEYNASKSQYDAAIKEYEASSKTLAGLVAEANSLSKNITDLGNTAQQIADNYKSTYENPIKALDNQLGSLVSQIDKTIAEYQKNSDAVEKNAQPLADLVEKFQTEVNKGITSALDPNFNEAEYKQINGLTSSENAWEHYVTKGKDLGLYTNYESASVAIQDERTRLINDIAKSQGYSSIMQISNADWDKMYSAIDSKYGDNLVALRNATASNIVPQGTSVDTILQRYDPTKVVTDDVGNEVYGDWRKPDGYTPPEGTKLATAEDVMSGKAKLLTTEDRQSIWVASTGEDVVGQFDIETGDMVFKPLHITVVGAGSQDEEPTGENVIDASEVSQVDPMVQMYTYANVSDGIAANFNIKGVVQAATEVVDYLQSGASDVDKLKIATIVKSTGSVMQDVGTVLQDLSVTIGLSKAGDKSTLATLGKQLEDLASAKTPEQYQKAMADIKAMRDAAKGADIVKVNAAIAEKYPDLVGISVFGGELFEELIQNGVGKAAMIAGGSIAAILGAPSLIAGAIGAGVGYGVSMAMDFSESYRGAKEEMYTRMYDIYKEKGYSDAQAAQMAEGAATKAGVMNGLITMVVNGATPGDLNKVLFGGKASPAQEAITNYFVDKLQTAGKVALAEFGEGAVEGALQGMYNETLVYSVDPSKADYAKGMPDAIMLESIIGPGAAVGAYAVDNSFDMAQKTFTLANEQFTKAITSGNISTIGELGTVFKSWGIPAAVSAEIVPDIIDSNPAILNAYSSPTELTAALKNSFGFDNNQAAEIADIKFDSKITTVDEAKTALLQAGLTNVSDKDVLSSNIVGVTAADQAAKVSNYANQNMVSEAELKTAATQEGYTPTQAELDKLVGRGVQADVIAKFIAEVDPKAVTTAEATQYFKDQGYTKATASDIAQFVKSAPEEQMKQAVAEWVNPRQVTRAEALQFFSELGYTPTEQEITQYVVQGPEVFQDAIKQQLGAYVDPRYVDAAEVRDAFKALGLTAPVAQSDILRLSGQYAESELAAKAKEALPVVSANAMYALMAGDANAIQGVKDALLTKIEEYKNLNMTQAEAQAAATQAIASQLGTDKTALLNAIGATEQNLLVKINDVEANLAGKIEQYRNEGLTQAEAQAKALDEMSSQLGTTKADLLTQIGATEETLNLKIADIQTALEKAIKDATDAGLKGDEALQKAIDTVSSDLGATKSDLLTQLGTTETNLKTEFAAQLGDVQTALEKAIKAATDAGLKGDEALQKAIDTVAGDLGTTKTDLLTQLGTTETALRTEFTTQLGGVQTQLQSDIADTKKQILDQMQAYQSANVDADTALSLAISGVAQDLGVTKADLLAKIGTTETNLKSELAQQSAQLTSQIQNVQQLVGRPSQQVTAADATTIQNMIAGTTPVNLAYDTNSDGKVDQADLTAVNNQLAIQQNQNITTQIDPNTGLTVYVDTTTGQPIPNQPAALGGQWAPTGIYAALQQQEARQAQVAKAQAAQAKQAQQKNQFGQLMNLLFQAPDAAGQQVTVKTPDPSKINYIYDWSSIFATPSQASMMPSPYGAMNTVMPQQPQQKQQAANQPLFQLASGFAEGGIVGGNDIEVGAPSSVDDLLNILKGNG